MLARIPFPAARQFQLPFGLKSGGVNPRFGGD
jgi:hypothetical protein